MSQEPILWANKAVRKIPARKYNEATQAMEDVFHPETGQRVYERIPQRGHVGGDYDNPIPSRAPTWIHVLRHDGHVVRMKLTNAAADLDTDASFPRERRAKARFFGWLLVGSCPLAALITGDVQLGQLLAKEIHGQAPCTHGTYGETKPCPHYLAEERARKALQAKETTRLEKSNRSEADKLISAQQEQTKEIVTGVAGILAGAIREVVPAGAKDKK